MATRSRAAARIAAEPVEEVTTAGASLLTAKAQRVVEQLARVPGLEAAAGDTPILDFLREILAQLLPTLLGCFKTPAAAAAELQSPRLFTRLRLRTEVRREVGEPGLVGPICDAIWAVAKTTTAAELKALAG